MSAKYYPLRSCTFCGRALPQRRHWDAEKRKVGAVLVRCNRRECRTKIAAVKVAVAEFRRKASQAPSDAQGSIGAAPGSIPTTPPHN